MNPIYEMNMGKKDKKQARYNPSVQGHPFLAG